jgi:hypothetical protein
MLMIRSSEAFKVVEVEKKAQKGEEKKLPVFIKINEYRDVIDTFELIKRKLKDAKALLAQLEDIKAKEEYELDTWQALLSDVDKKVSELDKILLAPNEE